MEEPVVVNKGKEPLDLPPGFGFHPTDEEIITYYLTEKVMNSSFSATAIGEADLNKSEPWDLPKKAKMGEKEWYFFCQKGCRIVRKNLRYCSGLEWSSSCVRLSLQLSENLGND
ncbi:hypothetical protein HN51_066516 [Arachis hypogaea]|uniref:NAC domain-containing protein 92 n=1 Tax=Arachis ipaensis TaxID=130454 RepID=UPI0007AFC3AE|nr:NAC domain-containing protein 92 [Arachis ipaensis]XP_020976755.1 NAC domain-containing protein 92 [Arachis ipaensis]XP_025648687.1 NAC domain-containing protein 87 [Arachis hypogaea]XP_025648688.1 NAC domain-containing protein 87 [Arachis hypogaea]QHO07217.1 NAC domain-containing protein [Arachis hypogaea]